MSTQNIAAAARTSLSGQPIKIRRKSNINWWITSLLIVFSLTILVPMYFVIVNSLKTPAELQANGFALPTKPVWQNFPDAWNLVNIPQAALNSGLITVGAVAVTLITHSMVAYAIARNLHRKRFKVIYYYLVTALFIPFPIVMLPLAKETALLHLNNQWGLILLYLVYGLAFNVFIFVGYIRSIPIELEEAAAMDGLSRWGIFWKVVFPLLTPMNATVGILTCLWVWNDFMLPLVILSDPSQQTLPLVQYVFSLQLSANYNLAFASYLMAMAPLIVVYIFSQRWVVSGVMRGSAK